mmetsp:Transcript_11144/g.24516  ORF Transcript_11144/g.24516 Transcript_11144/m.24516 type:complete len:292 (-) Transcript_11144:178-1053(-)
MGACVPKVSAMADVAAKTSGPRMPAVYINHGGGPLPLLGKQPGIAEFLGSYAGTLPRKPTAILVVTAHWETGSQLKVSGGKAHSLYFDYGGFPKESYEYTYPAPGSPELANRIISLLAEKGLRCTADASRGWDHGVFVPLMLMFPEASVPVVSMSLYSSQDASQHMEAGEALQGLRDEGVLIVGSGASFHNFGYFFARDAAVRSKGVKHSQLFHSWLAETVQSESVSPEERKRRCGAWAEAPGAREAQPQGQAEHLMPLFVLLGAAGYHPGRLLNAAEEADGFSMSEFEFP